METGTILLTLDGSEFADQAIGYAQKLATALNGRVMLLDVLPDHRGPAPFSIEGARLSERRYAMTHLQEAQTQLLAGGVREVEIMKVENHSPPEVIVDAARELDCDAVVMATHGRGSWSRLLRDSTTDQVVRQLTDVPVVLIHPDGM